MRSWWGSAVPEARGKQAARPDGPEAEPAQSAWVEAMSTFPYPLFLDASPALLLFLRGWVVREPTPGECEADGQATGAARARRRSRHETTAF